MASASEIGRPEARARMRAWLRLARLTRRVEAELRERLRPHKLTLSRVELMHALHVSPDGLRMTELATTLAVTNGAITALVEQLLAEGMVERRPAPGDRRVSVIRETPRGREAFAAIVETHAGWIDELLADLDRADLERLNALTGAIRLGK